MADDWSVSWDGLGNAFDHLDRLAKAADAATQEIVGTGSVMLVAAAQRNFAGAHAPGQPHTGGSLPNVVTGDLRRSISADPLTQFGPADWGTIVAPRMIYGRRVELGFNGSPGYPYFAPAVQLVLPEYQRAGAEIWARHLSTV